jgi:hypothetical protein
MGIRRINEIQNELTRSTRVDEIRTANGCNAVEGVLKELDESQG